MSAVTDSLGVELFASSPKGLIDDMSLVPLEKRLCSGTVDGGAWVANEAPGKDGGQILGAVSNLVLALLLLVVAAAEGG